MDKWIVDETYIWKVHWFMGIRCSVKSQVIGIRQHGTKQLYVLDAYILIGMIKFLEKYWIFSYVDKNMIWMEWWMEWLVSKIVTFLNYYFVGTVWSWQPKFRSRLRR